MIECLLFPVHIILFYNREAETGHLLA